MSLHKNVSRIGKLLKYCFRTTQVNPIVLGWGVNWCLFMENSTFWTFCKDWPMVASCKAKFPDLIYYKPCSCENLNICHCTHPSITCHCTHPSITCVHIPVSPVYTSQYHLCTHPSITCVYIPVSPVYTSQYHLCTHPSITCHCTHPSITCLPTWFIVCKLIFVTNIACSPVHYILLVRKHSS